MTTSPYDADVVVVGAGPAGVAAALMAASLDMRTVIVETDRVGGKLRTIGALDNVPGNWSTGLRLAEALSADLQRLTTAGRCTVVKARAVRVRGLTDRAELTLEDGSLFTAQVIVVATGVATLTPDDVGWITAPTKFAAPPLWRTAPQELAGRTYVLGGDRPLGTWLRAHPTTSATLHVLCPHSDDYKVEEVAGDRRVHLIPVARVAISRPSYGKGWLIEVENRTGERTSYMATTVLTNLGSKPSALGGLTRGGDGYCPPELQHPRIHVAGDVRAARFQRISTAQGSGSEAVLKCYYASALRRAL
ncbi:FAD-dependent oxidoreductase [Streptomyces sp. V1I6]|uniref:FAD-dependent oxidoreductase n=1 Tax=Streptomyces sp. V1I6 TaxID=3042273 RepID=UPI0027805D7A|nr:FAD-dependent oxidoreductase [Streptomyces sp. V1I6]MDQ0847569.1 glycine/D-amino acid oxidase-like deaminating enzyme [Streptomyces sp. V1I6]